MRRTTLLIGLILVGAALVLVACGGATPTEEAATAVPTEAPVAELVVPNEEAWAGSAHADAAAEAFRHWDEEDPQAIPVECAKCHSETGYRDFLGVDGSAAGVVDKPAAIGTVVSCITCHNDVTLTKTSVVFPSGVEVTGIGDESRCMECHQGRASTVQVNEAIAASGVADEDTVMPEAGFINIHYFPAGATLYGTIAKGGYQYDGKSYDANLRHAAGLNTCQSCHNTHSLEIKLDTCKECHTEVTGVEDLKNVRMNGSLADYDGDGDVKEGVYYEMDGLRTKVLQRHPGLRQRGRRLPDRLHRRCLSVLLHRHQRQRRSRRRGGCGPERLQVVDAATAESRLQLPDVGQGPGRLRPRRQVHHAAAL